MKRAVIGIMSIVMLALMSACGGTASPTPARIGATTVPTTAGAATGAATLNATGNATDTVNGGGSGQVIPSTQTNGSSGPESNSEAGSNPQQQAGSAIGALPAPTNGSSSNTVATQGATAAATEGVMQGATSAATLGASANATAVQTAGYPCSLLTPAEIQNVIGIAVEVNLAPTTEATGAATSSATSAATTGAAQAATSAATSAATDQAMGQATEQTTESATMASTEASLGRAVCQYQGLGTNSSTTVGITVFANGLDFKTISDQLNAEQATPEANLGEEAYAVKDGVYVRVGPHWALIAVGLGNGASGSATNGNDAAMALAKIVADRLKQLP